MPGREFVRRDQENSLGTTRREGDTASGDESAAGWPPGDVALLGDSLPLGVLSAKGMGSAVYANRAAAGLLGKPRDALLEWGWESAVHADDLPEVVTAIALVLDSPARQRVTVRLASDPNRWLELTFAPLGRREQPNGWIATIDEVSDRVHAERVLAHRATHDPLTRLPNRMLLADRLETAASRLGRAGPDAAIAVLFCDLDDFKDINNHYGHLAGDAVLVEVARRLSEAVRASDTVARWGGDEFVAVCELAHVEEADAVVERVTRALSRPVRLRDVTVPVYASIGTVVSGDPVPDIEQIVATADSRMYAAKHDRRRSRPS